MYFPGKYFLEVLRHCETANSQYSKEYPQRRELTVQRWFVSAMGRQVLNVAINHLEHSGVFPPSFPVNVAANAFLFYKIVILRWVYTDFKQIQIFLYH